MIAGPVDAGFEACLFRCLKKPATRFKVRLTKCRAMYTTFRGSANSRQFLKSGAKSAGIDSKISSVLVQQRALTLVMDSDPRYLQGIIHLGSRMTQFQLLNECSRDHFPS